ncbi:hypothetical protein [Prevotella ihumii]|uniref:hypothetical protein n=1 Tax=Prevotella ihumii TaxID=1917878 RepID=UPI00118018D0|nr:hypothetical protein [Prevotella ihumii]
MFFHYAAECILCQHTLFNPNRSLDWSDLSDTSDWSDWSDWSNDRFGLKQHNELCIIFVNSKIGDVYSFTCKS